MNKDTKSVINVIKRVREAFRDYYFFHEQNVIDGSYYVAEFRLPESLAAAQDFIKALEKGKGKLTNDHFVFLYNFKSLARQYNIIANELNAFVCDTPYQRINDHEIELVESFRRDCEDWRARPKRHSYTTKQFKVALERLKQGERLTDVCKSIAENPTAFETSLRHWYKTQFQKPFSVKRLQGKS